MAAIDYINFDLQIERSGSTNRYRTRVNSSAGETVGEFTLPFSDLEFENFLLRIGRRRQSTRSALSAETEAVKNFGGSLFAALFHDEVLGCLRSSLASRQGSGLRLRLLLTGVPELADVPWEYLYDRSLNQFLALSTGTPVVRYLDLPERIRPLVVQPPLRMLVMISSPTNYPRLDVESEWKKLRESLTDLEQRGLVVLTRLDRATLPALQSRLRREDFHIFHFIGHGGFDQAAHDGVLMLEDEAGLGRPTSGQELGTFLHDHRPMRLAVLNACEGARADRVDPFAGVAQSLVQKDIPAVIAMQFEITDKAAITFSQEFYGAVADGYSVDEALAESRKAIYAGGFATEWGTPVLYLRTPDGRIFDVQKLPVAPPKGQQHVQTLPLLRVAESKLQGAASAQVVHRSWLWKWFWTFWLVFLVPVLGVPAWWIIDALKTKPATVSEPPVVAGVTSAVPSSGALKQPGTYSHAPSGTAQDGINNSPVTGGVFGGIPGQGKDAAVAPPPPKPAAPTRVKQSGNVTAALIITQTRPLYPPLARQARVQGNVVLHAIIDKDGRVAQLEVISGHPLLVQSALDAVKQWRYKPTTLNGDPVEVDTTITVTFMMGG